MVKCVPCPEELRDYVGPGELCGWAELSPDGPYVDEKFPQRRTKRKPKPKKERRKVLSPIVTNRDYFVPAAQPTQSITVGKTLPTVKL